MDDVVNRMLYASLSLLNELDKSKIVRFSVDTEYLIADTVLQIIEEVIPGTNGRVQNVGKPVKAVFGADCSWSRRKDNKTWYKIRRKLPASS